MSLMVITIHFLTGNGSLNLCKIKFHELFDATDCNHTITTKTLSLLAEQKTHLDQFLINYEDIVINIVISRYSN